MTAKSPRPHPKKKGPPKRLLSNREFVQALNAEGLLMLRINNDYMEPTLRPGDFVLVDMKSTFRADSIYAVSLRDSIEVRRMQFIGGGTVRVLADKDKRLCYEIDEHNPEFRVVGAVVWTIRRDY